MLCIHIIAISCPVTAGAIRMNAWHFETTESSRQPIITLASQMNDKLFNWL